MDQAVEIIKAYAHGGGSTTISLDRALRLVYEELKKINEEIQ